MARAGSRPASRTIFIPLLIVADLLQGVVKMARNERTSKKVASKAGKILSDPKSTKREKSVAASALTQARNKKRKSKR